MEERSTGVWAPLRATPVYSAVQSILGSPRAPAILVDQYLRPDPGADMLDMGCGPGLLLGELGPVRYTGFNPSESYIAVAKERFGDRGVFLVGSIGEISADQLDTYDLVVAKSVLHHVDDSIARDMFKLASAVLRDGGTVVTSDCCCVAGQSPISAVDDLAGPRPSRPDSGSLRGACKRILRQRHSGRQARPAPRPIQPRDPRMSAVNATDTFSSRSMVRRLDSAFSNG
jgi:SAM-dependent methyltransferase